MTTDKANENLREQNLEGEANNTKLKKRVLNETSWKLYCII